MESIDKLRKRASDRQQDWEKVIFAQDEYNQILEIADEIEAEIERDYIKLPVDAYGEPIHMGDTVEGEMVFDDATAKGTVTTYHIHDNDEPDTVYIKVDCGNGTWTIKELRIKRCRHVKPRTLEDVLVDMLEAAIGYSDAHTDVSLVAVEKYADEIRELLGGDAE